MIYFPYIDPTNYTEFVNNDVKSSFKKWVYENRLTIAIYAGLFITAAFMYKTYDHMPLLIYLSILALYFLVIKKI